ncbi:hypothetical protein E8E11_007658 [Didymella keratinophila]|nr:hypothetical protein E8E11_007658 [Didymella keratinophila]
MRLINTKTLLFEEFDYPETPSYAILSHTWTKNEVLYADFPACSELPGKELGYAKIYNACKRALDAGIDYCWVDTCCIDKKDHSELSEAINSMYNWYKESKVCYAYLSDVISGEDVAKEGSSFARSKWFKRGWTLQELLAPHSVIFFASDWRRIGRKRELAPTLSNITRIPLDYLQGKEEIQKASVAQRMSWVSRRETTKPEDRAYCLMGLFGIHMPPLYGEREPAAFKRLQLEILKDSDDTSIFAWACDTDHELKKSTTGEAREKPKSSIFGALTDSPELLPLTYRTYGLLARSPVCFDNSSNIIRAELPLAKGYSRGIRTPLVINNKGLHLCLPLREQDPGRAIALSSDKQMVLGCQSRPGSHVTLDLRDVSKNGGRFVRVNARELGQISKDSIQDDFVYRKISTETRVFNAVGMLSLSDHIQSAQATTITDFEGGDKLRSLRRNPNLIKTTMAQSKELLPGNHADADQTPAHNMETTEGADTASVEPASDPLT